MLPNRYASLDPQLLRVSLAVILDWALRNAKPIEREG
jgi:hypothetical protein